ncbi:MAG: hypothetical protein PVH04_13190 [Gammaproteobacteria bacterium]|jgi:inorganic pyrophosphatase
MNLHRADTGNGVANEINANIDILSSDPVKYAVDKETGATSVDR